jgi:hypothetical protein
MPRNRRSRGDANHLLRGIRTSTANNAPAYGFSLAASGSFVALEKLHGTPSWLELFLFLAGACMGVAAANTLSTWFFQRESPDEPEIVVSLATSLSVFSVCGAVGAATGIGFAITGWPVWPVASLVFSLVCIALVGAELGVAARQHHEGGVGGESTNRRQP